MMEAKFGLLDFEHFRDIQKHYGFENVLLELKTSLFGRRGVLLCFQLVEISWIQSNRLSDLEEGLIHQ